MSTVETNQSATAANTTGAAQASSTANEANNVNNDQTTKTTADTGAQSTNTGTAAGEAAKTGLLIQARKYAGIILSFLVSAAIIYFFGSAAIDLGTQFMQPGVTLANGWWTAVKASIAAGLALNEAYDLLKPVGQYLYTKAWVPFRGLFAKKVKEAAEATAEAAAASEVKAEAAQAAAA